ncbi:SoxR reducing system RseC family protein [Ursidibacter maritimus]|uniref:SoxR reducing system RseC family protein n=1 Tax=Ursidibacter maritimus TaxID=1331689 RepID=UPI001C45A795|nr:SoxR reducing system RseC family protein [Ursidibacter maritimus]MBV6540139.1 SoxR reducing system RseC family protein [Ursidibacter maritimus]
MMIEQATVLDYQNGVAKVQCFAKSGCGACSATSGCGTKSLSALAGEKVAPQFELSVNQVLSVGDRIEIGLAENSLLISVFWLYLIPLIALVGSTLLLSQWISNELGLAFGIFTATAITFVIVKKIIAQKQQGEFIPIFLRKI